MSDKVKSKMKPEVSAPLERLVRMPAKLTAENGAKTLLTGEFHEIYNYQCPECAGDGTDDEMDTCRACNGAGEFSQQVDVSWTTIKEIYALAVKHLGS
ncbi:MAG: hypothetical protein ACUZ8H_13170 [Candidatus Anammoxibacter sp.]